MILGQSPGAAGPTAQHPIDFTPPTVGGGNIFKLPRTGFYSQNISPLSSILGQRHAFPGFHPRNPNVGPQAMPPITQPAVAAAPAAPAPGPTPAGTNGSFGGSGFGSSGGVRPHGHIDPYTVMRSGMIPGVSPSGSNIRAGYQNAGARVEASMPFQSHPLAMAPAALPMAPPAAMPANTHGGLGFSWNPVRWFQRPAPRTSAQMVAAQNPHGSGWHTARPTLNGFGAANRKALVKQGCTVVGPRLDGTKVTICNGQVMQVEDSMGNVLYNPNMY